MKLTGWYQGDQKPVYVGYFERQVSKYFTWVDWWDGKEWVTEEGSFYVMAHQNLPWRGVAK